MLTTNPNTTNKVQMMRSNKTDLEVCEIIGISKPTLYKRLRLHNWKKSEIVLIKNLK